MLLFRRVRLGLGLGALALAWAAAIGGWLMPAFGGPEASLLRHAGKFGVHRAAHGQGPAPLALLQLLFPEIEALMGLAG